MIGCVRANGLALLLLATLPVAAETTTRLSKTKPRHKVRRNYALPPDVQAVDEPAARKGRVEKFEILFFDVDGNGEFDDANVDGWALPKMPFVLPLEDEVVIGRSIVTWKVAKDGSSVVWTKAPIPVQAHETRTLVDFNTWRFMNGLPGVSVDRKLSDACARHCAYMERHGMTHHQKPGETGYTEEGAQAGRRSCLTQVGPKLSVLTLYASFYHRLPLISPETQSIGIGVSRRYTAIDGLTDRRPRVWRYPIIVPAPNSWFQPTHFAPEQPRPYPQELENPGFPITLTFDTGNIGNVEAELRLKGPKGAAVRILVSSPEHPANKKRPDNRKSICIIPRQPLAPKKTYWVHVSYARDGKHEALDWLFNTGPSRPVFRR
jgi:uncharacterized protein YkwD